MKAEYLILLFVAIGLFVLLVGMSSPGLKVKRTIYGREGYWSDWSAGGKVLEQGDEYGLTGHDSIGFNSPLYNTMTAQDGYSGGML